MPKANKIEVNISGDNYGNIIIGDHNILGTPHGIKVNKTKAQSNFERRTKPVNFRPRAFSGLLGRANELVNIQTAIANDLPITLFGESGIGKTSLIRQASHLADNKKFTDGVIYLYARGEERDDLLQQVFDSIYVSTPSHKPTEAQIRNDLKNIHALIFLDDISLQREDISYLLDAMPKSLFVLASEQRLLWGEGEVLGLDGLPEAESVQLFERELDRKLDENETLVAIQICKILLHHPLRILQTASLMREDGQSIQQVFASLTKTQTKSAPLEVTLQKSNETQKKILSLLAVAGGFALTREHLARLAGAKSFDVDINSLVAKGLVENQGATFSLSGESVASLVKMWDLSGWEDALTNHFSNWLQTAPQDMLIDQVANTLFYLIQRAGEKKQWNHVVVIGRRLEQFYALKKKWEGWLKILKLIQLAAKYLKDQYLEGWATHQLGSRAMCLDLKTEASELLNQALKIRKAIGDTEGLQVTQHNLNVLANLPLPENISTPKTTSLRRFVMVGGIVSVVGLVGLTFVASLLVPQFISPTDTPVPTFTSTPTAKPFSPTPSFTPTRTVTPTNTATPTVTTRPLVMLYDFVRQANDDIYWETINFEGTVFEGNTEVDFREKPDPDFVSYQAVMDGADEPYVGWIDAPPVEDGLVYKRVLLTFPHAKRSASYVNGYYDLSNVILQAGDRFEAKVGHVFPYLESLPLPYEMKFQVYFISLRSEDAPPVLLSEVTEYLDGNITEWSFDIPSEFYGQAGYFVLKIYTGPEEPEYDWGVWMSARLLGEAR